MTVPPLVQARPRIKTRSAIFFEPNKGIIVMCPNVLAITPITSLNRPASTIVQKYPRGRTRAIQRRIQWIKSVLWCAVGCSADGVPKKYGGFEITIENPLLETLPATGGIGSVIFTVSGAAIVLLAGVLFVIYMKKRKAEE